MDLYSYYINSDELYGFDKIPAQQVWAWHRDDVREMIRYEKAIKKDPKIALRYAELMKLRFGYIPPMEDIMTKTAHIAYAWAYDILDKKRFKEGEPVIAKDIRFAYQYAFNIVKGRWKEAEDTIATDAMESLKYASNVMGGRFPKGEPKMKEDKQIYNMYLEMVEHKKEQRKEKSLIDDRLDKAK